MLTGNQLKAARAIVGMSQGQLAKQAGININTVVTMEKQGAALLTNAPEKIEAVKSALEASGVEFLFANSQPGVRLRKGEHGG